MYRTTRRQWMGTAIAPALAGLCKGGVTGPAGSPVAASVHGPEPKLVAAIITIYRYNSHADVILGKILEGWKQDGGPGPALKLASVYVDQFPSDDMSRDMCKKHGVPIFDSIEKAITVGGNAIPVDGVLCIGEHGDYPWSDLGQQLYPRRRFFEEIADTFEKYGRVVPVFNDKHLGPQWDDALWTWKRANELKVPFMAGSSMPVGYRTNDSVLPMGTPMKEVVGVGYSGLDVYGIHALEFLQWHTERRPGAETGVRWVECLKGKALWDAVDSGKISNELLRAAIRELPGDISADVRQDPEATAFVFEYLDGLRATQFMFQAIAGTATAVRLENGDIHSSAFEERTVPRHPHFAFLLKAIERMIHSGKPSYPIERTVLTGGILDRSLRSLAQGGRRLETPELAISYSPVNYLFGEHVDLYQPPVAR